MGFSRMREGSKPARGPRCVSNIDDLWSVSRIPSDLRGAPCRRKHGQLWGCRTFSRPRMLVLWHGAPERQARPL